MDALLTPEQQQQAKARQDRRQAMGKSWNMNLTADQRAKIKTIRESSEQQLNEILTPEQQTKLKSRKSGGWQRKG